MHRIHVSLPVKHLGNAKDFYSKLFGTTPSKERDDYVNFRLDVPPLMLALQESKLTKDFSRTNVSHLGVELPELTELARWRTRFDEQDLAYEPESKADCCYAKAEKLWTQDPDGNVWEIWVRTGEGAHLENRAHTCC